MSNEIIFKNQGILKAKVSKVIPVSDNMTILYLYTRNGNAQNSPTVLAFDEMSEEARKYQKGDFVSATAKFESKRRKSNPEDENSRLIKMQSAILTGIEPAKSVLESVVGDDTKGEYHDYENRFVISGTLNNSKKVSNNFSVLSLYVVTDGRPNLITFTYYGNPDKLDEYEKGDNLAVICAVQTKFVEKNSRKIKKEQLVIKELTKI